MLDSIDARDIGGGKGWGFRLLPMDYCVVGSYEGEIPSSFSDFIF